MVELGIMAWVAGGHSSVGVGLVNEIAYNLAILVWFAYVLMKEQRQESAENLLIPQRWEQSFMDVQHPMPRRFSHSHVRGHG